MRKVSGVTWLIQGLFQPENVLESAVERESDLRSSLINLL